MTNSEYSFARSRSLEQTLALYGEQIWWYACNLWRRSGSARPIDQFYLNHRDKFLEKARQWLEKARMWAEQNGTIIRGVREVRNKIERVLGAQNAPPELLATDMCMPIPGSAC